MAAEGRERGRGTGWLEASEVLALVSAWIALITFLLALGMVLFRPLFTDLHVLLIAYFGSPGAICLAGLVLWAHRKDDHSDLGLQAQRVQAKVAIALAVAAAAIVYALVIFAERVPAAT